MSTAPQSPPSFAGRLLRQELLISHGCTEPAALALAAAAAAAQVEGPVQRLLVRADLGTYKNSLSVGLPGADASGPELAAAAGQLVAAPEKNLNVLAGLSKDDWRRAAELVARGAVVVEPRPEHRGVWICARAEGRGNIGEAFLAGRHDRLVEVRRDGLPIASGTLGGDDPAPEGEDEIGDETIRGRIASARDALALIAELSDEELDIVREGLAVNRRLAERSLRDGLGLGFGRALRDLLPDDDPAAAAKRWVAAGVEARMAGVSAPVATSGGSGNSGLTVSLGTWAAARALGVDQEPRFSRALALAHLLNVAVKARIGRVGPLCGGTSASSIGVAAALTWLLGGAEQEIDRVIRHLVDATAGTLCDGAKPACALKIAGGLGVAVDAARLAARGAGTVGEQGLGGATAEQALARLERLAQEGYGELDRTLTNLLRPSP